MNDSSLKVFVLGAGCSRDCGYPLASEIPQQLREFAAALDSTRAPRLIRCVNDTLALMSRTVDTFDTLVQKIDAGHYDDTDAFIGEEMIRKHQLRSQRVQAAKLAISALFHFKEAAAFDTGLKRYRDFLGDLFPVAGSEWNGMDAHTCCVLTFNYDRVFEIAFQDRFNVDLQQWGLYGGRVLNAGLDMWYNRRVEFTENRFSFLKLHGSIGMWADDDHGDTRHHYLLPEAGHNFTPTDDYYFAESADGPKPMRLKAQPLLVFPHERQRALDQQQGDFSQHYLQQVWARAAQLMSQAAEVSIVGYSFASIDRESFLNLLGNAKACKRIVVQNPDAVEICGRLEMRHPDWKGKLTPCEFKF